jgi:hypothetical protein
MLFPVRWHSLSLENKAKFRRMMEWFRSEGSGERDEFAAEGTNEAPVIEVRAQVPEVQPDGSVIVELFVHPLADGEAGGSRVGMPDRPAGLSERSKVLRP